MKLGSNYHKNIFLICTSSSVKKSRNRETKTAG
uniref:Uncharacterized protein n=1 Tax=Arundo donax TaxID=35708 RepID=A0A0A8YTA4_ARUDO